VSTNAVSKEFAIQKVTPDAVVVGITLHSDATGSAVLRLPVSKKGSSGDFFTDAIDL
jgi:hypothetical protein